MRLFLLGFLVLFSACRRPSAQLSAILSPVNSPVPPRPTQTPTTVNNYSRYLKDGYDFMAVGQQPAWTVLVHTAQKRITLLNPNGDSLTAPLPMRTDNGDGSFSYLTDSFQVRLQPQDCINPQTGEHFGYRADLTLPTPKQTYSGCGLSLQPLQRLSGTWKLTQLYGRNPLNSKTNQAVPSLTFDIAQGKVTGFTGCNRLFGNVLFDTWFMQFDALATTRMACLDPQSNRQESEFLQLLNGILTYDIEGNTLTFRRADKTLLVFSRPFDEKIDR